MPLLEKEVEEMIFHSSKDFIKQRGLSCFDHDFALRQVGMGMYGIADLVSIKFERYIHGSRRVKVVVYELKKDSIGTGTLLQASAYYKAIYEYLTRTGIMDFEIEICLIGAHVDLKSNFIFLAQLCNVSLYTYEYKEDGIWFSVVEPKDYIHAEENHESLFSIRLLKRAYKCFYKKYLDLPFSDKIWK